MAAPTPAQREPTYKQMWDNATVTPERAVAVKSVVTRALAFKATYKNIGAQLNVPWPMIIALHNRESGLSFSRHMHNGDPLNARTVQVPKGRPVVGNPPFTFAESAKDALCMPPHSLQKVGKWSIERVLYECEKYNGWGYVRRGLSPYLVSWTNLQRPGKYVADGKFDPNAWDKQAGCVAVLKQLAAVDAEAAQVLAFRDSAAPKEVLEKGDESTRRAKAGAVVGAGTGAGGTGTEVAQQTNAIPVGTMPAWVTYGAVAFGVAIVVVALAVVVRKRMLIQQKWGG